MVFLIFMSKFSGSNDSPQKFFLLTVENAADETKAFFGLHSSPSSSY